MSFFKKNIYTTWRKQARGSSGQPGQTGEAHKLYNGKIAIVYAGYGRRERRGKEEEKKKDGIPKLFSHQKYETDRHLDSKVGSRSSQLRPSQPASSVKKLVYFSSARINCFEEERSRISARYDFF